MKRVVSLVLAVVLAFGMASVAFAAPDLTGSGAQYDEAIPATAVYGTAFEIEVDLTSPDSGTAATASVTSDNDLEVVVSGAKRADVTSSIAKITGADKVTLTVVMNSATATSAEPYTAADLIFTISADSTNSITVTAAGSVGIPAAGSSALASNTAKDFGGTTNREEVVQGNDLAVEVTLATTDFTSIGDLTVDSISTTPVATGITVDGNKAVLATGGKVTFDLEIPSTLATGNYVTKVVLKDSQYGATAKTLTVDVYYTVTAAPVTVDSVPASAKIVGINPDYEWSSWTPMSNYSKTDVEPDDQIRFPLCAGMFLWDSGTSKGIVPPKGSNQTGWYYSTVTETHLSRGNIDVKTSTSKGSAAIRDVSIQGAGSGTSKYAYIRIRFVEYFVNTSDLDYDLSIYLSYKNSRKNETKTTITGTIENEPIEVYEGEDYVNVEDGNVIKAEDYVRNLEIFGGNGVSAFRNVFKGQKYYFVATMEVDSTDSKVMDQYPSIDNVIKIRSVNMSGSGTTLKLDMGPDYYVYNEGGEFIGRSNEELPFSNKLYLSTERITMTPGGDGDGDGTAPTPDDGSGDGSTGDGSTGTIPNDNDNPGTGANGLVNVAVVTGMIALAAAGAVSLKK